jgi:BRCA2, helical
MKMSFGELATYRFTSADDSWSYQEALHELQANDSVSAKLLSIKWVENHYKLVLWKLRGYVRAYPHLENIFWTKDYVVKELLFRLE